MIPPTKLGEARPTTNEAVGFRQQGLVRHDDPHGLAARFSHAHLRLTRPWFSLLGRKMYVHAPSGELVAFVKRPMFKLREQFTIYADESETVPLLAIKARSFVAFNMAYDVVDCASGQRVGTIRRQALASILRDTYDLLDERDQPVGRFVETGHALLRRLIPLLLGEWQIEVNGQVCGRVNQEFRWFAKEFVLDMSLNQQQIDPRFAVALTVFALVRESSRENNS